jgi:hypothetical protein
LSSSDQLVPSRNPRSFFVIDVKHFVGVEHERNGSSSMRFSPNLSASTALVVRPVTHDITAESVSDILEIVPARDEANHAIDFYRVPG